MQLDLAVPLREEGLPGMPCLADTPFFSNFLPAHRLGKVSPGAPWRPWRPDPHRQQQAPAELVATVLRAELHRAPSGGRADAARAFGEHCSLGRALLALREFGEFESADYSSAVNYAILGYGDIVMSVRWRLLGPLEAGDGIVMFGISTALIFALMMRLIEQRMKANQRPGD
jgi:hypothetical protein